MDRGAFEFRLTIVSIWGLKIAVVLYLMHLVASNPFLSVHLQKDTANKKSK